MLPLKWKLENNCLLLLGCRHRSKLQAVDLQHPCCTASARWAKWPKGCCGLALLTPRMGWGLGHIAVTTCNTLSTRESGHWAHLFTDHTSSISEKKPCSFHGSEQHWKRSTENAWWQSLNPQQDFTNVNHWKIILRHFELKSTLWRTSIDKDWLQSQLILQGVSFEENISLDTAMESHVQGFSHITRESLIDCICLQLLQSSHCDTLVSTSSCPKLMTGPKQLHLAVDQKRFVSSYTVMSSSAKNKAHLTKTFCVVGIFNLLNPKHSLGKW